MNYKKIFSYLSAIIIIICTLASCEKEAGEGGNASVQGKVLAKYYNNSFTTYIGSGYAQDKEIFIIYGDDITYSERIRTNYDGSFEFKYLRKGNYSVYIYSKDSTLTSPSGEVPVIVDFEIKKNNETLVLPDITIFD